MANEVSQTLSNTLTNKLTTIEKALPSDFNTTRFVQNCIAVLNDKPELGKVNQNHLIAGILKGAYMGLDFMKKECYLIPYGNSVQFQTDYKGEKKFVKKYSTRPIKDIYAKLVREGDSYYFGIENNSPVLTFKPKPFNDGEILGAFAVVLYEDNGMMVEEMTKKEINEVRTSYSKMSQSKPWKNSWGEMAKKTVLRRLCKHIDVDFESVEAQKAWEETSGMDMNTVHAQRTDDIVDVFSDEPAEYVEGVVE